MGGFAWTAEQDEYLRRHAASRTVKQLADHLGRSVKGTRARCVSLGLEFLDGRSSRALDVQPGQEFGRLTVLEVGHYKGNRAARVSCSGPHDPVEKWVNLHALTSGLVKSCGCLRSEDAADRARERNAAAGGSVRLGTGRKGLPPGVKYIPKGTPPGPGNWRIADDGRECAYGGEGNCGHQFKPWDEFDVGNAARGRYSWCRSCRVAYNKTIPAEVKLERSLASCCRAAGITVEQYRLLEASHDGRCWLCGEFETVTYEDGTRQRLAIEHDRSCCNFSQTPQRPLCGKCVRGLCCHRCNRQVLGSVEAVGADKVFKYLASAQTAAQAILAID